jgi:polysaccharide pyruvyl transferase WcaK-like protein
MNVSIERLEQIELERSKVIADPAFQLWMRELNVSQSWSDPELLFNAREMNSQYDFRKNKVGCLELSHYL